VIDDIGRGEYLVTEDFYTVLLHWQSSFLYLLEDRSGKKLVLPEEKIEGAFYTLTIEQEEILNDELYDVIDDLMVELSLEIFTESNENPETGEFEERLVVLPVQTGLYLKQDVIESLDKKLRNNDSLANLPEVVLQKIKPEVQTWQDFLPITSEHQYMQAAVYVKERKDIQTTLSILREMGLFASSPLERYLKTFAQQEQFYVGATVAIFILILFLAGSVLFSTFYASVQRKRKQIGILKATGAPGSLIRKMFYIEAFIIACLSSIIGVIGGLQLGKYSVFQLSNIANISNNLFIFHISSNQIIAIVLFICLFCWIAVFIPAWIASRTDPAQVIRS
jgi:ABC-type antimicrobial peptide transport system permease subunit